jgi:hypothetical protein
MKTEITQIITHPGGAHKDEFLACAVLLTEYPVSIERRDPKAEDLANASTAVLDIGHLHEPDKNNFDHHQFPREQTPTCSLSLVLQAMGLYEDARLFCDWLEVAEWLDCRGAGGTAEWMGVERDVVSKLNSPIDVTMLRRFSGESMLEPGDTIWELIRMIGEDLLKYIRSMRSRIDGLDEIVQIREIEGVGKIVVIERADDLPQDPIRGLHHYLLQNNLTESIVGMAYPDSRGEGYGIKRYDDHPSLDFTRIEEETDVHFAHKSGFLAKTSANDIKRLDELFQKAVV